jgi:hypothetical protein
MSLEVSTGSSAAGKQVGGTKQQKPTEREMDPRSATNVANRQHEQMRATAAIGWITQSDTVKIGDRKQSDPARLEPELQMGTALDRGIHAVGALITSAAIVFTGETPEGRLAHLQSADQFQAGTTDQPLPELTPEQTASVEDYLAAYAAMKNGGNANELLSERGFFGNLFAALKARFDTAWARADAIDSKVRERRDKELGAIDDGILAALETKEQLETGLA